MTICRGIVRGNTVVLEEGADLPDGAKVEVHLAEQTLKRGEAFDRVLANRINRYSVWIRSSRRIRRNMRCHVCGSEMKSAVTDLPFKVGSGSVWNDVILSTFFTLSVNSAKNLSVKAVNYEMLHGVYTEA